MTIFTALVLIADSNSIEKDRNYISDKKYLLVIDSEFISCPLCQQSFTEFIEVINANGLERSVLGILVHDTEEDELNSERDVQIVEKQLRGFISGNNIKFPIILDKDGIFSGLNSDSGDTALILFDIQKNIVKKYKFPLTTEQLNEISRAEEKIDNSLRLFLFHISPV